MDKKKKQLLNALEHTRELCRSHGILDETARPKFEGEHMSVDALFAELSHVLMDQDLRRVSSEELIQVFNLLDIDTHIDHYDTLDEGWNIFHIQVRRK